MSSYNELTKNGTLSNTRHPFTIAAMLVGTNETPGCYICSVVPRLSQHLIPESILTPMEGHWKFQGGRGSQSQNL